MMWKLYLLALFALATHCSGQQQCNCSDPSLCRPLNIPPRPEVLAFYVSNYGDAWRGFDWSLVTTITVFGTVDPELLCFAHSKNVRVTIGAWLDNDLIPNVTARTAWMEDNMAIIEAQGLDGVNIDIEGNTANRDDLSQLTRDFAEAVHSRWPGSQVTFDTSIYPDWVANGYDMPALAAACDFLVVMAYDMLGGGTLARANDPYENVVMGMNMYRDDQNISGDKLVLGVPWYGYDFPCDPGWPAADASPCNCSQQATGAWEIPYVQLQELLPSSPTGRQWNNATLCPYFNYVNATGAVHQIWYDDPQSLTYRYQLAGSRQWRGVAFWNAAFLDYNNATNAAPMWNAVNSFFPPGHAA